MIAKPEWFKRRKYAGWGVYPKTWQGWVYLAAVILPFVVFQSIQIWDITTRTIVTVAWLVFLGVDVFDVMARMNKDEREKIHEAIAERNALWAMMLVLVLGVGYEIAKNAIEQKVYVDPFIIAALVVGLIVKAISNIYLDRKD